MKKIILLLGLIMSVSILGACGNKDNQGDKKQNIEQTTAKTNNNQNTQPNENQTAIYLVKLDKQKTDFSEDNATLPFGICSGQLTPVIINEKLSPQKALETLLNYPNDTSKGIYNAFSESQNIKIDKLLIKNNFAIVTLSGDIKAGEPCLGQLMHDQITKTLSQFDNIAGADVFVGDKEINTYLNEQEETIQATPARK